MKGIIFRGPRDLVVIEESAVCPPDSILTRTVVTGISAGTERMWYLGTNPAITSGRRSYPYYPGYEFLGEVIEVGQNTTPANVGDRIIAMKPHADQAALSSTDLWAVVPSHLSSDDAIGIPLTATCIHTLHRGGLELGDTVAIVGLGVIGLLMVQVARAAGAGQVIAVGRSGWKRDLAASLGADAVLDANDPGWPRALREATGGPGADLAVECAGEGAAVESAITAARVGGRVAIAGFHVQPFEVSGEQLFSKELTIYGVRSAGGTMPPNEYLRWTRRPNFELAVRLVSSGQVRAAPLVTHRYPAHEIRSAYEMIASKTEPYLQVLIDWSTS